MRKIKINDTDKYISIGNNLFIIGEYLMRIKMLGNRSRYRCRACDLNYNSCMTNNSNELVDKLSLCFIFRYKSGLNLPLSKSYVKVINKENSLILNCYINRLKIKGVI